MRIVFSVLVILIFLFGINLMFIRYHWDFGFNPAMCVMILLLAMYFLDIFCWFCLSLGDWHGIHKLHRHRPI